MTRALRPPSSASDHVRADWIEEFIYGTIAVLIAMAGFDLSDSAEPVTAGAIIFVSAAATWLAHAYAAVLGRRLTDRHEPSMAEVIGALRSSWPVVIAAIPATLLAAGASVGWWSLETAIRTADVVGIVVLAGAGILAGRVAGAGPVGVAVWALITAGIGGAIVLVELAVHH